MNHIFEPFKNFVKKESFSGVLLLSLTILAMIIANSGFSDEYFALWHINLSLGIGDLSFSQSLHFWINDGLMAIFFLLVGLEIKRELIAGELSSFKLASLPIFAAVGGMLFPAIIFVLLNYGTDRISGWAIPTATDIAFSIGILSLLGNKVSLKLKIFLVALAIVDDMGAVIIIALFYGGNITVPWLLAGGGILAVLFLFNYLGVLRIFPYVIFGVFLWICFLLGGIHPTIAGVLTAASIPVRSKIKRAAFIDEVKFHLNDFEEAQKLQRPMLINKEQQEALYALEESVEKVQTPLLSMEHRLHSYVSFLIMPLFAFSNAGVQLPSNFFQAFSDPVVIGITLGLLLGKPVGITLMAYIAVKMGIAYLPENENFKKIFGVGFVAGIGFTMSLFIANLAYGTGANLDISKIGILTGSLLSGVIGFLYLRILSKEGS